jgi:ATP-binding cassette, subfamily G (WHITE), member 2, PDR
VLVDVVTALIVAGIYYRLHADVRHFTSYVAVGIMLLMIGGTSLAAWLMYYTRYRHRMHQEISLRRQSLSAYAIFWTLLLVVRVVLQNGTFLLAAYWLAGMRNTANAFFVLVLIFVLGGWITFAIGMVMSAAGLPFGLALPATLLLWIIALVFSTGLVAADAFAKWARVLSHASFMRHAIEAVAYSQLGGQTLSCGDGIVASNGTGPFSCPVAANTLLSLYGMSNNLGLHVGVLVIWIVIIMALVWSFEWAAGRRLTAKLFQRITGMHQPGSNRRSSMLIRFESASRLAELSRRAAVMAASTEAVATAAAEPTDADELQQQSAADEPMAGNGVGGGSDPLNGQPFEFRFEGATFRTAHNTVLSGVSGVVRSGFMTAVLGASGAGKSTLLNVLFGIPLAGRVEATLTVNGSRIHSGLRTCAIAALSPQENALDPWQTVWETLRDAAVVRGRQPLIGELLHIFHMEGTEWRLIHTLSESERRCVAASLFIFNSLVQH